ncbi:MAG: polysaccharide deacetylase family protein [Gammaproteobacteria bacterium]|nr:polysaccharide deacetylase family protein [Gammaproteobacteria bacterium]
MNNGIRRSLRLGIARVLHAGTRLAGSEPTTPRILMYHRVRAASDNDPLCVEPGLFADQVAWLAEHAEIVRLGAITGKNSGPSRKCRVAITFDDGYLDNLTEALPILVKHSAPATLFVTSQFCDQSLTHPRYQSERGQVHMTWDEVREWCSTDLLDIGSHSLTHAVLPLADDETGKREIIDSKKIIEDRAGFPAPYFAYPNGAYINRDVDFCREAGYIGAVTTHPGPVTASRNNFELNRTEMNNKDWAEELELKIAGAFDLPHRILDWKRERKLRALME